MTDTVDPWTVEDDENLAALGRLGTDELIRALGVVGADCTAMEAELAKLRRSRLLLLITLEERDVSYRRLAVMSGISDVAVMRNLQRHHLRLNPEPIV